MIAALFVAGPAVLLAVMAWAIDRFMPFPPSRSRSVERDPGPTTTPQPMGPSAIPPFDAGTIRKAMSEAGNAQEFVPLAEALKRFEANRSRSMAEDHYPDPVVSRYTEIGSLELKSQRIVFEKDGGVRLEARSAEEVGSRRPVPSHREARASRLNR